VRIVLGRTLSADDFGEQRCTIKSSGPIPRLLDRLERELARDVWPCGKPTLSS
jgi:hypothetical protein